MVIWASLQNHRLAQTAPPDWPSWESHGTQRTDRMSAGIEMGSGVLQPLEEEVVVVVEALLLLLRDDATAAR